MAHIRIIGARDFSQRSVGGAPLSNVRRSRDTFQDEPVNILGQETREQRRHGGSLFAGAEDRAFGGDAFGGLAQIQSQLLGQFPEIQQTIDAGGIGFPEGTLESLRSRGREGIRTGANARLQQLRESANRRGVLTSGFQTGTERRLQEASGRDEANILRDIDLANEQIRLESLERAKGRKAQLLSGSLGFAQGELGRQAQFDILGRQQSFVSGQSELDRLFQTRQLAEQRAFDRDLAKRESRSSFFGNLGSGAGQIGTAALLAKFLPAIAGSSKTIKENINDIKNVDELFDLLKVKTYDYKPGFGDKNRIGLIAEDSPTEVRSEINGIPAIDVYSLVSLLIAKVQGLQSQVNELKKETYHGKKS